MTGSQLCRSGCSRELVYFFEFCAVFTIYFFIVGAGYFRHPAFRPSGHGFVRSILFLTKWLAANICAYFGYLFAAKASAFLVTAPALLYLLHPYSRAYALYIHVGKAASTSPCWGSQP